MWACHAFPMYMIENIGERKRSTDWMSPDSLSIQFVIDMTLVAPLILLVQSLYRSIGSHDDT